METVNASSRFQGKDLRELLEVRRGLELEIVRLAALRRTEEELEQLACLAEYQRQAAEEGENWRFLEADITFHQVVAVAAHNSVLLDLYKDFEGPLRSLVIANMERYPLTTHCDIHLALYEAIRARDVEQASRVAEQFLNILLEQLAAS